MQKNENEGIKIDGFLSIKKCDITISQFSAFIGPQASGKSIVVKLIYFCREYIEDFFRISPTVDFSLRSFKSRKKDDFLELFKGLSNFDRNFRILYNFREFKISIEKSHRSVRFIHNKEIDKKGKFLQRRYSRFLENLPTNQARRAGFSIYEFMRHEEEESKFYREIPSTLFVPASRSFYATVSQEVFEFLRADSRIDPLTAQFGSFYDFARRNMFGELFGDRPSPSKEKETNSTLRPILKGDYFRRKNKDFIKTDWGEVPLDGASSGQQEALPLLLSILMYPEVERPSDQLIIEEPEAHLYPEAQKYILDLIIERGLECNCGMMFTTHSPYVLACLNTHAVKLENGNPKTRRIDAFFVSSGHVKSLVSRQDGLIDLNELDQTSEKIANEFMAAASDE